MASKKMQFYDITNARLTHAQYIMLLGQRANGKSYQVKNPCCIEDAWDYINDRLTTSRYCKAGETRKTGKFIYLRRWQADIKAKGVEEYFDDSKKFIKKLTNGLYDGVTAYNGSLYFYHLEEDGSKTKSAEIGRYHDLNELERYKSRAFVDFTNIIYEEFITDGIYLDDEPTKLQQYVSTIARLEEITVFLVGNTLSRVCPYFSEWCLEGVLKQKQGTIDMYHYHVGDSVINIAVEYCASANIENKMFFGQASKQIISGEWDTKDVPKLPRKQSSYEKVYEILVVYQKFEFVIELLVEPYNGGKICFIYPHSAKSKKKFARVISDVFTDNPMQTSRLDMNRIAEQYINECFMNNKVCYSDNLTGSDFRTVNEHFRIGSLF